jgi:hypothetical protein
MGFVTGSGSLDVSAERAAVAPDAVNASGYEMTGSQTQRINQSFQGREVNARIHVTSYAKAPNMSDASGDVNTSSALEGAGTLTVVSVPGVNVAGFSLTPLEILPDDLLFELAGQQGTDMEAMGTTNMTMLGQEVKGETYRVSMDNTNLVLERASVNHEGDLVVVIATYPEGGESPRDLISAIEYPA